MPPIANEAAWRVWKAMSENIEIIQMVKVEYTPEMARIALAEAKHWFNRTRRFICTTEVFPEMTARIKALTVLAGEDPKELSL
jgi:hypothetical protein